MSNTWVNINNDYQICEEDSRVKSLARRVDCGAFYRNVKETILAPQNGFVNINMKSTKVSDLYYKAFGRYYE